MRSTTTARTQKWLNRITAPEFERQKVFCVSCPAVDVALGHHLTHIGLRKRRGPMSAQGSPSYDYALMYLYARSDSFGEEPRKVGVGRKKTGKGGG